MEKELFLKYLSKDTKENEKIEIRNSIFSIYKGLAIYICKKINHNNVDDDLLQEGYIALQKAIETFNPSKNILFRTYACNVIKTRMVDHLIKNVYNDGKLSRRKSREFNEIRIKKNKQDEKYKNNKILTYEEELKYYDFNNFVFPIQLDKKNTNENDDEEESYIMPSEQNTLDFEFMLEDIKNILNDEENIILNLLLKNESIDKISEILKTSTRSTYYKVKTMKNKIKKYLYE